MQCRHDTSLLYKAAEIVNDRTAIPSRKADAAAYRIRRLADARGLLAAGVAIAIAALGIGIGMSFAWPPTVAKSVSDTGVRAGLRRLEREYGASSEITPSKATTNYAVFKAIEVQHFARTWRIQAGHHFDTSEDPIWARAWCYTSVLRDGVVIRLDLADRKSATASAWTSPTTPQMLQVLDLTNRQVAELARDCPWLESDML
ncbi:MAG: hypothetical protein KDE35_03030 [Geminicoccaceae bacterium]|nr:hypothetical protein [Geminicoccaceae bacterium]